MGIRFYEGLQVLPVLAPLADSTSVGTDYVDIENAQWITYLVQFGAMTSDSTDIITVTVEVSTDTSSNATELQVPFNYRLSAAVGTDTPGTITAVAAATGVPVTAADDNKLLLIDVDPAAIPGLTGYDDHHYCRLWLTKSTDLASNLLGVIVALEPRYAGNDMPNVT